MMIPENGLSVIAARHHMIDGTWLLTCQSTPIILNSRTDPSDTKGLLLSPALSSIGWRRGRRRMG